MRWPAAVVVVPGDAGALLTRSWVYTAFARGERHLSVVQGAEQGLAQAVAGPGRQGAYDQAGGGAAGAGGGKLRLAGPRAGPALDPGEAGQPVSRSVRSVRLSRGRGC